MTRGATQAERWDRDRDLRKHGDPAAPHNEHEWTRFWYLEGLRLSRERNATVAEPLRSIINSFSVGVGR